MKHNPLPSRLNDPFDEGETIGVEMIRSTVETLRTVVGRGLQLTPGGAGMDSLDRLGEPTATTVLSRLLSIERPALGLSTEGIRDGGTKAIRSKLNGVDIVLERSLRTGTSGREVGSLEELGGSTPVSAPDRLLRIGDESVSRRAIVRTAGYAMAASAFGAALQSTEDLSRRADQEEETAVPAQATTVSHDVDHDRDSGARESVDREQHTILEGTQYETIIHTITSPNEGPTAMIFGGVHGNELGGIEAARLATEYTIDRGTLVVSPETNKAAVEMEGNHGPEGDLNRQFPIGGEPTTEVAQGIWDEIVRADPDYLIDAHNATTLMSRGSVGQGVFPTSEVVEEAEKAVATVNEEHLEDRINDDLPEHAFQVGPVVPEDRPRMNNKAAADRNIEGWSVEVTRIDLTLDERAFLQDVLTRELLHQIGIDVVSDLGMTNPL